jgi:hypothetical protein
MQGRQKQWVQEGRIPNLYTTNIKTNSVADPGCLSRIPEPTFSIPDPGSEFFPSRILIKEVKYFNPKKCFLSSRKYDPGSSSQIRIPDPDTYFLPIPDTVVKKAPDPGSGSATLIG